MRDSVRTSMLDRVRLRVMITVMIEASCGWRGAGLNACNGARANACGSGLELEQGYPGRETHRALGQDQSGGARAKYSVWCHGQCSSQFRAEIFNFGLQRPFGYADWGQGWGLDQG